MKIILTNKNAEVFLDDDDVPKINRTIFHSGNRPCIWDNPNRRTIGIGAFLTNPPKGFCVDHIDGNPFNNLRSNLRICSRKENTRNQSKRKTGTSSIYKGVKKFEQHWIATIKVDYKVKHLGTWDTEREAAICYNYFSKKLFLEFSRPNTIENLTDQEVSAVVFRIENNLKRAKGKTSIYRGVCKPYWSNRFMARVCEFYLGYFSTQEEAAIAVNKCIQDNNLSLPLNVIV